MKKNILLLLTLCLCVALQAQVSINPPVVVKNNILASDADVAAKSMVKNSSMSTKTFKWERRIMQMTEGWFTAVCDKNQCYLPSVSSREFTMGADEEATMDVHVYPSGIEGSAIIEVTVTEVGDTTNKAIATYYFNQSPSNAQEAVPQQIRVYPNPSQGLFTVSANNIATRLEVFNLAGQRVKTFEFSNDNWYDIHELPRGTYFVRLIDRSSRIVVTRLLNKV